MLREKILSKKILCPVLLMLLIYPFKLMIISGMFYLCFVPVSLVHYLKLDKQNATANMQEDNHEDIL